MLLCLGASLALGACSNQPSVDHHHLRIADGAGDLVTLNPHLAMGASLDHVAGLSMAYLVRFDEHSRPYPELATDIPSQTNGGVSADGLRITWHLRRGARWSDGAPFDARDVVFSTRAILNPANNEVLGTEGWNLIDTIESPDPYTVVYHLKRPYGALIPMMFVPIGAGPCILPQHILGALPSINAAAYNAKPVGIGPFRVVRWVRGERIDLEANPYYFRGRPKLDRVTFKLIPSRETLVTQMRSGEVDLWPLVPPTYLPQLSSMPGIRITRSATLRTTHLDFLMTPGVLADRSVRRAMRLAIDRPALIRDVEGGAGYVTDSVVWPGNQVTRDDPRAVAFNSSAARKLLALDGWKAGPDGVLERGGKRLSLLTVYQSGAPDIARLVELIRAQLRSIGIELQTKSYPHSMIFGPGGVFDSGKFDVALYASTITSVPDLASNFDCATFPPRGENFVRWCDRSVNAQIAIMRTTYDPAVAASAFRKLDAIFVSEAPSIQLFVWQGGYAMRDALTGYRPNLVSSFDQMMDVDI